MNKAAWIVPFLLVTTLSACHRGEDVSVDGNRIVLHPSGVARAHIEANGTFSVGQNQVELSAAQKALFMQYHDAVVAVHRDRDALKNDGKAMAVEGLHLAGKQLRNALAHSGSSAKQGEEVSKTMQAKAESMGKMAHTLCGEVRHLKTVQDRLGKQVSAFKPYADINAAAQINCSSRDTESAT